MSLDGLDRCSANRPITMQSPWQRHDARGGFAPLANPPRGAIKEGGKARNIPLLATPTPSPGEVWAVEERGIRVRPVDLRPAARLEGWNKRGERAGGQTSRQSFCLARRDCLVIGANGQNLCHAVRLALAPSAQCNARNVQVLNKHRRTIDVYAEHDRCDLSRHH